MPAPRHSTVTAPDGTHLGLSSLGRGDPVLVVGGAMRTSRDYLPLAAVLAHRFEVHVLDRRGRGVSGPQSDDHFLQTECDDLVAVQEQIGAAAVFGHSFGGLVVLETAARTGASAPLAVYEPGMSLDGSLPTSWLPGYRERLARGDTRGAFAHFVQGSGHAPAVVARMPTWYLRVVLRVVVRGSRWRRLEPLLGANLREHEALLQAADGLSRYAAITAPVLLLGGAESPHFSTDPLRALHGVLPESTVDLLPGLDHNAPDEKAPEPVAERVLRFLDGR